MFTFSMFQPRLFFPATNQ